MLPLQLTTAQHFEIEKMSRVIDCENDADNLRRLCKQLLQAWEGQKAATRWMMNQQLGSMPAQHRGASGSSS